ncbi:MAG: hypothetical protein JKX84_08410 [Flavobacteriales bacterium]|nr:hypothetical protein [Flavobacteriales bacterium]
MKTVKADLFGVETFFNAFFHRLNTCFLLEWLLAFVLVIIARLPYLLSDHVYFDGDEAMLGIMGRDLITGKALPIYFYGQQYGFSFFEVLSVGMFIPFLGSGVASLKLGGTLLFSLGIQRFMKVFRAKKLSFISYLLVTIILVLFPTWLVWGTKLRGGYITAFVGLAFIVEQLFLHANWERKNRLIVSGMSALILVSQPFFLLPVFPILVQRTFKMKWSRIIGTAIFGGLCLFLLRLPASTQDVHWTSSLQMSLDLDKLTYYFVDGFWASFTGYFAFSDIYVVPTEVKVSAMLFCVLLILSLVYSFIVSNTTERKELYLLLMGVFISIFPVSFFGVSGGRFLLPFFTGLMVIIVFIFARSIEINSLLKQGFLTICIAILSVGLTRFDGFVSFWMERQLNDMKVLNELVEEMRSRGIKAAFVSEWQTTAQLNYLGNDEMNFRFLFMDDRLERAVRTVNNCYLDSDCSVALTGSLWPLLDMQHVEGWNERIIRVNERFYLMENPEEKFLKKGGFELPGK